MTVGLIILLINLLGYHFFYRTRVYAAVRVENKILRQQNEYFRLSQEEFEQQWLLLSKMQHDLKNSCVLEMDYLEKGRYDLLMDHYRKQIGEVKSEDRFIHTGNIGIDSIVNYKLSAAKKQQIEVKETIQIAGNVTVGHMDLNILIGNLMDNAIEAARDMEADKRKIELVIRNDRTAFFLEITNLFKGERIRDGQGDFLTCKSDKMCHGIGLKAVKDVVRKYDGQIVIDTKKSKFHIKVLIYMDSQL